MWDLQFFLAERRDSANFGLRAALGSFLLCQALGHGVWVHNCSTTACEASPPCPQKALGLPTRNNPWFLSPPNLCNLNPPTRRFMTLLALSAAIPAGVVAPTMSPGLLFELETCEGFHGSVRYLHHSRVFAAFCWGSPSLTCPSYRTPPRRLAMPCHDLRHESGRFQGDDWHVSFQISNLHVRTAVIACSRGSAWVRSASV